ncbi:MAG: lytic murein transglycosylase, partial [Actinobacteria bacterium]|nr:lytic murein transglycosylase [Actinomycetota bacterium]
MLQFLLRGVLSAGVLACAGLLVVGLSAVTGLLPGRGLDQPAPAAEIAAPAALPDVPAPAAAPAALPAGEQGAETESGAGPRRLPGGEAVVFSAWASRMSQATGIPARALEAYANAHAVLAAEQPGCNLTWVTLAGIATVESGHGTYRGRTLLPEGLPSSPIIGIPLNGVPGVRAIGDTDSGLLDGDTLWDRAVGPFQFIPSTWARWRADANGDGRTDPQNIDDGALAAARYLCAGGRSLNSGDAWLRAVLSYNKSVEYAQQVYGFAQTYA